MYKIFKKITSICCHIENLFTFDKHKKTIMQTEIIQKIIDDLDQLVSDFKINESSIRGAKLAITTYTESGEIHLVGKFQKRLKNIENLQIIIRTNLLNTAKDLVIKVTI